MTNERSPRWLPWLLCGLWLTPHPAALALEADRTQPIRVSADRIEVDQKKGVSRYVGNVVFSQGSLRITASKADIRFRDNRIESVVAWGNPVTFRQRLEDQDEEIEGRAARAEYHAEAGRLDLFGDVSLQQGRDTFRSAQLRYHIDAARWEAEGSAASGRAAAVYYPKQRADDAAPPASAPPTPAPGSP